MMSFVEKFMGFGLCARAERLEQRLEQVAADIMHWPH